MVTKPGYTTTEFWITILTLVLSGLVAAGVIGQEEADTWKELLVALIPPVVALVLYIWSRTRVKTAGK